MDMAFDPPVVSEFDVSCSFSDSHNISAVSVCSHFFGIHAQPHVVILATFLTLFSTNDSSDVPSQSH